MQQCPVCGSERKDEIFCGSCGYDEHRDFVRFRTVSSVSDLDLKARLEVFSGVKKRENEFAAKEMVDNGLRTLSCSTCSKEWYEKPEDQDEKSYCPRCGKLWNWENGQVNDEQEDFDFGSVPGLDTHICQYPDGSRYEGQMKNGKRHGTGKMFYTDMSFYEGEFMNDLRHGQGIYRLENGQYYKGEWKADRRHGQGEAHYAGGNRYIGDFRMDHPHGKGIYYFANDDWYEGDWKAGDAHGKGAFHYANGELYEGDFSHNLRHGKGIYYYINGDRYEGDFRNDKRHGKGTLCYINGDVHHGKWEGDKLIEVVNHLTQEDISTNAHEKAEDVKSKKKLLPFFMSKR